MYLYRATFMTDSGKTIEKETGLICAETFAQATARLMKNRFTDGDMMSLEVRYLNDSDVESGFAFPDCHTADEWFTTFSKAEYY